MRSGKPRLRRSPVTEQSAIAPPTLDEIYQAQQRLEGVARHTPIVSLYTTGESSDIYLKLEIHQPITSFKIRGVFNAVATLDDDERAKGISTTSAGNTAQAIAWCGQHFGIPARSLMPETAPQTKVDAVRAYGGEPVFVTSDELFRYMRERGWEDEPYAFIHPWTNRNVMIGHATMGLEILEDCPDVETVYIPVGGGGLLAGVASALKLKKPDVRIVAVEPEGCPTFHESLKQNEPAAVACQTICDGVAVPYMTDEMFPLLRELVDASILISEDDVRATIRRLALGNRIIAEGAGALAAAAAITDRENAHGPSVALVTGGSIDTSKLISILQGAS